MKGKGSSSRKESTGSPASLKRLQIFDRLEVGPVRLERRRIRAPYRLVWDGRQDQIELVYRYSEDVFDPDEIISQNLASMIAAQVAINYGLFCRSIVFHGVFDETDRRFIRGMSENTAREIYVKKFLQPNPFLRGPLAHLPVVRRKRYLSASLEFPRALGEAPRPRWQLWSTDRLYHAVLSSGGKDSLLSYGLLEELGHPTHPIFVNESGRHWFTALNAYRYFQKNVPNTVRVWVNSDRIFTWMLRHMDFIRQDFATLRSDDYPIRLWTVAVFLFGALPIMRKRRLGRLIVGDEFDTTRRLSHRGITHYDGLYDQSQYFDQAMSRYYLAKGWSVSQFSILRPLSELLIEKILVERYPHLQAQQMSCHAAHQHGNRIRPCGRCEKCHRIVGLLTALGADPRRCGYTSQQIRACLLTLSRQESHQAAADAEHLLFLLSAKGLVVLPEGRRTTAREHPEISQLRFDAERSALKAIPADLRRPLYRIYLEHAQGAVKRTGRSWRPFDPLADAGIEESFCI